MKDARRVLSARRLALRRFPDQRPGFEQILTCLFEGLAL
jgi:hypothetical protein